MTRATIESTSWPDGIIQLLDDHHLVVLADEAHSRSRFGNELAGQLGQMADTEVVPIDGRHAADLPSFCRQLETRLATGKKGKLDENPWWRDMHSVIEVLRNACSGPSDHPPKRRYFIWHDADTMLEADVELFCRLVNALFGVSAECEHVSLDPVVLQRVVFIGGDKLGAYAEDSNGQFCRWLEQGEDEESPFWEVVSVVERPPVIVYRVEG